MGGPTLVGDIFGGVDPEWYLVWGLEDFLMNVFFVCNVRVFFWVGFVDESVGDALTGERADGERVFEEGGGGVKDRFAVWLGGMMGFVVGVVVVEFVVGDVRVEEEGGVEGGVVLVDGVLRRR